MSNQTHSKSGLFYIELTISLFFFCILVTFCMKFFSRSNQLTSEATQLHHAVTICSSIAQIYQSAENVEDVFQSVYPDAIHLNQTILIYFNQNFEPCTKQASAYRAYILVKNSSPSSVDIQFLSVADNEEIYSLTASSYEPISLYDLGGEILE